METISITKAAAIIAHEQATVKQKSLLENLLGKNVFVKNIRERIQTLDDIFELNNTTEDQFMDKWEGFDSYERGHALELLIVAAYNEGKSPDWTNDDERKYFPYFKMGSPSGVGFSCYGCDSRGTLSGVGSRQVFIGPDAYENLLDATKKFLSVYQQSRTT